MEWSVMGFRVMFRYRVDASKSGGCVRVILKELQCSPFSVIQDQHSLWKEIKQIQLNALSICV